MPLSSLPQLKETIEIKDYALLAIIVLIGAISCFKIYDDNKELPMGQRIRKTIYGMGGSILTTWIIFELLEYYSGFPFTLCLAIASGCGYIGAEGTIKFAQIFIDKNLDRIFSFLINSKKGDKNV